MRVIGTIRSTAATDTITAVADTYESAREQLEQQLPDGYQLIVIRVDR